MCSVMMGRGGRRGGVRGEEEGRRGGVTGEEEGRGER